MNIKLNDININYIKEGTGTPILILEGWGTNINVYQNMINFLKDFRTVYCFDMPGFGMSTEPIKSFDLNDYIDLVINFINSQNIKELDIIAHSNGGRIILNLLTKKTINFKINKLILIGSAGIKLPKSFKTKTKIAFFKINKYILNLPIIKKAFPNCFEKFQNKFGSEDYKNASPIMRKTLVSLISSDSSKFTYNISIPTLLIWGENDTATPIKIANILKENIPDCGLISIKNSGHYVFLENPNYVHLIIKTFIKEA